MDITDGLLREWKQALAAEADQAFPGHGNRTPADEELHRLQAENKRLRAERDILKKSDGLVRHRPAVIFQFIRDHEGTWPVRLMCRVLGASAGGYSDWRGRPPSPAADRRDALTVAIKAVHAEAKARYGSPRVHAELAARGVGCCVNTVAKRMRAAGVRAKTARRFRCTTDSNHRRPVADNVLDRAFTPAGPNASWVADITYIPTAEGWVYLAAVEGLYSRAVVGWSMGRRIDSRLVVDALDMAVARRCPGEGLVAHSDRGSQYASEHYRRVLAENRIVWGMSRRGDCGDNAPMATVGTWRKRFVARRADR